MNDENTKPQTFQIRTLRDIFELPTPEMMERALSEIKASMIAARGYGAALAETARILAEQDGVKLPEGELFQWPEVCEWKDDNGGESRMHFTAGEIDCGTVTLRHARQEGGAL